MYTTKEKEKAEENSQGRLECPHCHKLLKGTSLRKHLEDMHTVHLTSYECKICHRHYRTPNSLQNHSSRYHRRHRQETLGPEVEALPFPQSPVPSPVPQPLSNLLAAAAAAAAARATSSTHISGSRSLGLSNGAMSLVPLPPPHPVPALPLPPSESHQNVAEKLHSFSDSYN